jgi:hypothetical protein
MKIDLYPLLFHLKNCPGNFLELSAHFPKGNVNTEALVADCQRMVSDDFLLDIQNTKAAFSTLVWNEATVTTIQMSCWFFAHPYFLGQPQLWDGMERFMFGVLPQIAPLVAVQSWIDDEDRTEEFVRLALDCCGVKLDGESENEAADRLAALSTIKRQQVLSETSNAFERMMEIRRKMAEDKAREAANVYGRE